MPGTATYFRQKSIWEALCLARPFYRWGYWVKGCQWSSSQRWDKLWHLCCTDWCWLFLLPRLLRYNFIRSTCTAVVSFGRVFIYFSVTRVWESSPWKCPLAGVLAYSSPDFVIPDPPPISLRFCFVKEPALPFPGTAPVAAPQRLSFCHSVLGLFKLCMCCQDTVLFLWVHNPDSTWHKFHRHFEKRNWMTAQKALVVPTETHCSPHTEI